MGETHTSKLLEMVRMADESVIQRLRDAHERRIKMEERRKKVELNRIFLAEIKERI